MSRLVGLLGVLVSSWAVAADVELFSRAGCPHCAAAKQFLEALKAERPGLTVTVQEVDTDVRARQRLEALAAERKRAVPGVPALLVNGELVFGFDRAETTGALVRELLDAQSGSAFAAPVAPDVCVPSEDADAGCGDEVTARAEPTVHSSLLGTLKASELGLPAFTLVVGLLDGFNPCAMWVLLFLLSILVNMKSRARMALVAGTFVLVSGAVYFAFMAAWLNVFLLLGFSRVVQSILGLVAVVVGGLNLKEFWAFKQGPSLSIPEAVKPGLMSRMRAVRGEKLVGALLGVAVLAVLVNFVELLCTAGFPAIYTHVLTSYGLPAWKNYAYLGLYNLAYITDDGLMVGIAIVTLGGRRLQEKEGRWLKLISGAVMLALGVVLLVKPELVAALG